MKDLESLWKKHKIALNLAKVVKLKNILKKINMFNMLGQILAN